MSEHAAIVRRRASATEHCAGVIIDEIAPRMQRRNAGWPSDQFVRYLAKKEYDGEISRVQLRGVLDVVMRRHRS